MVRSLGGVGGDSVGAEVDGDGEVPRHEDGDMMADLLRHPPHHLVGEGAPGGGIVHGELVVHHADLLPGVVSEVVEDGECRPAGGVSGEDVDEAEAECLTTAGDGGDGSKVADVVCGQVVGRGLELQHAGKGGRMGGADGVDEHTAVGGGGVIDLLQRLAKRVEVEVEHHELILTVVVVGLDSTMETGREWRSWRRQSISLARCSIRRPARLSLVRSLLLHSNQRKTWILGGIVSFQPGF